MSNARRCGGYRRVPLYTADGYLAQVRQAVGEWDPNGGPDGLGGVVLGTPLRYSEDRRDAMGRVVERLEYADGATVSYSRLSDYSRAGLIERETTRTLTDVQENFADYHTENVVTYDYRSGTGSGAWTGAWQGVVTRVTTTSTRVAYNGTRQTQPTSRTTYAYTWWDSAQQATLTFDSDTGSGSNPVYASTFGYDVNGRLSFVNIRDGRPRNVTFVTDSAGQVLTRREADSLATDDPFSQYYYFNGQRIGETTNDAAFDQRSYSAAVIRRTAPPSSGASLPFQGGVSNFAIPGAGFDYGYEGLRPDTVDTRGQAWTVRDGDTLQGIAAAVWGDASLWYLIAEHNGLTGASILSPGQRLTVPAKVANLHNTTSTFRPYDPNKALGDLNPTQPAPPKKPGGCGVLGQIIAVVIAVAVTYLTQGALAGPMQGLVASVLGAGASATTVATVAAVATAATAAAAGSVASQGFLMATGAQDSFDWKQLGITVLTASPATTAPASFARAAVQAAARNVVVQGVAVATGLQHTFDWTGVAVAAVVGGVSRAVGGAVNRQGIAPTPWSVQGVTQSLAIGTTAAAAGAATRSALTGSSFGDNLIAALPDVIGSTIGNAVAGGIASAQAEARENAITARTVELLESQNMRVEFDETGRPISALVSYIDDDGQTTYVESSAAVRAVRQQVSSGRYSQRNIQTGLQSNDQRRFFASSDYANRSASAYNVTVESIQVADAVTGLLVNTQSQDEVDAATRTARSDVLNTTLGYVNDGATHLANFADKHPNLAGMAVAGGQAALGGGPVKAVLQNVVREVVGDRVSEAASNAIQNGVSGLLQERAGVPVAQANLGGMGAAFGVQLLFGGADGVINFAKDIRGAIGGLFRRGNGPRVDAPTTTSVPITPDIPGGATNRAAYEAYRDGLRASMERPVVSDPRLSATLDRLYRRDASVGSGSTAAAVREELASGQPVRGRMHSQKAENSIRELQRWLDRNPTARPGDRAAAENVIIDMRNALRGN